MNVHPRSAGPAVLDSQLINRKHFSLGPFLYCLSNKKHKLALEGEEHQNLYTKVSALHKTFKKCVQCTYFPSTFPEKIWLMWILPNLYRNTFTAQCR